jgi:hypothetical protein
VVSRVAVCVVVVVRVMTGETIGVQYLGLAKGR